MKYFRVILLLIMPNLILNLINKAINIELKLTRSKSQLFFIFNPKIDKFCVFFYNKLKLMDIKPSYILSINYN